MCGGVVGNWIKNCPSFSNHQQVLFALISIYILNPTTSSCLHHKHSLSQHYILPEDNKSALLTGLPTSPLSPPHIQLRRSFQNTYHSIIWLNTFQWHPIFLWVKTEIFTMSLYDWPLLASWTHLAIRFHSSLAQWQQ